MNDTSAYSSAPLYSFGMLSSLSRCIGHYQDPFISSHVFYPLLLPYSLDLVCFLFTTLLIMTTFRSVFSLPNVDLDH